MNHVARAALAAVALASVAIVAAAQDATTEPPVPMLSPSDTLKTFQLPPGYRMEVVLAEPHIAEPVAAAFDGDGRMFVAEMRTYMQDIDATGEHDKTSRVSLHWSSKGDGVLDRHTVFADGLLLPRMILPLGRGELLINETDTQDIFLWRDTNGDGVADEKKLWFAGGPRGGNMEHQQSGLIWAQDNWLYATYNAWRLRWQGYDKPPLKESTPGNGGQWGLTQDDWGKPWFVNAGGEKGPLNFQTHILYGGYNTKDQFEPGFAEVWPLVGLADVQGGERRFRPGDRTLNHFTATCGQEIFRGDRLPAELRGNLFFSEPVGRLVRRTEIRVTDGLTTLHNPHPKSEFLRSTDPNFRVVNMNTAPDGTLYLVDMYRGIIQEGNWTKKGSYLRGAIQQHGLDKNIAHGRIWRLVHDDFKRGPQPAMYSQSPAQLVAHLAHPNGWWRDTAQKILVIHGDQSIVPALRKLAQPGGDLRARIHALWTLEGLGALESADVRTALADSAPELRAAGIRLTETLHKAGDNSLTPQVVALVQDPDPAVAIQALGTAKVLNLPESKGLIQSSAFTAPSAGLREIATQMLAPPRTWGKEFTANEKQLLERGDAIYKELCFACHNPDGKGTPIEGQPNLTLAPPLAKSRTVTGHKDALIRALLKGVTGPIEGKTYESQMVPMESNDDEWIAAVASFVRNSFGNKAGTITVADVTRVRAETKSRTEPWTIEELVAALPEAPLASRPQWKLSASHNAAKLSASVDGQTSTRWDTKTSQVPGMWFQIELPQPTAIGGLVLDSTGSASDFPRGYRVELSTDGQKWSAPVAEGKGRNAVIEIKFPATTTKFIRITQTGEQKGKFWSIHELDVLEPPATKAAAPRKTAKRKAAAPVLE